MGKAKKKKHNLDADGTPEFWDDTDYSLVFTDAYDDREPEEGLERPMLLYRAESTSVQGWYAQIRELDSLSFEEDTE